MVPLSSLTPSSFWPLGTPTGGSLGLGCCSPTHDPSPLHPTIPFPPDTHPAPFAWHSPPRRVLVPAPSRCLVNSNRTKHVTTAEKAGQSGMSSPRTHSASARACGEGSPATHQPILFASCFAAEVYKFFFDRGRREGDISVFEVLVKSSQIRNTNWKREKGEDAQPPPSCT